jgi:hypothetical protein
MRKTATIFAVSAFALVFSASHAIGATPNLSGDWNLNLAKSDYGPIPQVPEVMKRKITHADPSLAYSTYTKGPQGEINADVKYTTDGKVCVNKLPQGEAKGTAKWEGDNLVIESTREFQGAEIKSKETWSLGEGGKVLTVNSHITVPQGEFDIKLVFEKQ